MGNTGTQDQPVPLFGPGGSVGQPASELFIAGSNPANTRRVCDPLINGAIGVQYATFADLVMRQGKTIAHTPTRFRFRFRNSNLLANTNPSLPATITGIAVGTPLIPFGSPWAGVFASAPTTVWGGGTFADVGATEVVTPWISNASLLIKARVPFGVSMGINTPTPANLVNSFGAPSQMWSAAAGTAQSAQVASTGVPTGGTSTPVFAMGDLRLEYEFVGSNPIGLFLGTSITVGSNGTFGGLYGTVGMDNSWPNMVGLRVGHGISNGGIGGASLPTFTGTPATSNAWTRLLAAAGDGTTWPGGCTPDYAVLDLGVNDLLAIGTAPLATFKANMALIVASLNALGIFNIYVNTVPPSTMDGHTFGLYSSGNGSLSTALAVGANTTVNIANPLGGTATAPKVGSGGGYPGPAPGWSTFPFWVGTASMGNQEGPFPNTSAAYVATVLGLTNASFNLTSIHPIGDAVLSTAEGYRQLINQWIRAGVTGTSGTVDFSTASTTQNGLNENLNPKYYSIGNTGPHPNDPGMYEQWAQLFTMSLVGL